MSGPDIERFHNERGISMDRRIELEAYHQLLSAVEHLTQSSNAGVRRQGLTPSRLGVLVALHERGTLTPKDLSRAILRSPGNLTLVLDNMVRDGLVKRETDTKDRRRVGITLSDAGRKLAAKAVPAFRARVSETLGKLAERDLETLAKLCARLVPEPAPKAERKRVAKVAKPAKAAKPVKSAKPAKGGKPAKAAKPAKGGKKKR